MEFDRNRMIEAQARLAGCRNRFTDLAADWNRYIVARDTTGIKLQDCAIFDAKKLLADALQDQARADMAMKEAYDELSKALFHLSDMMTQVFLMMDRPAKVIYREPIDDHPSAAAAARKTPLRGGDI